MSAETRSSQFTLKALLLVQGVLCAILALAALVGAEAIALLLGCLVLALIWVFAAAKAPQATKYTTVVGMLVVFFLALSTHAILQSRDQAKRGLTTDRLRGIGESLRQRQGFELPRQSAPAPTPKLRFDEDGHAWFDIDPQPAPSEDPAANDEGGA
jgi:hypothetical protein